MSSTAWGVVGAVVIVVLLAVWIGNTIWWTRRNGNLGRRSAPLVTHRRGRGHRLVLVVLLTAAVVVAVAWLVLYLTAS